jgi:hypothetical protein
MDKEIEVSLLVLRGFKRAAAFTNLIELRRAVDAIGSEFKHEEKMRV